MNLLFFGGLLSTPAPTAPIIGIGFIALFAIVGIMVGPDYDGMNAPALNISEESDKDWLNHQLTRINLKSYHQI